MIEFISYEQFPEDNYTKELVYLQIDGKYRVAYVSKTGKSGQQFWTPLSAGIIKNGQRTYYQAIEYDSSFLKKDIDAFMETRPWEKNNPAHKQQHQQQNYAPQESFQDELPF